jgi:transposase
MIRKEDYTVIEFLHKRGVYVKDIAEELGVHPRTVSRALQRRSSPDGKRKPVESKLEPYKPKIERMLSAGVWNAQVILREIQADGYSGGYTMLRQYIQPRRKVRPSERATVRFETEPGQQVQSDWGEVYVEIAGERVKVYFIVNELCYSRRFHFWCTDSLDAEHTYEGLIRSFEYFGGVSEEVLVDNQKSAVLTHPSQGQAVFNERFIDLGNLYGFTPRACKPYRARTKGKDERMVGYIKNNFFVRYRSFESWEHLNQLAERWLAEEADQRLQGTVKEIVAERFGREQPVLKPLPKVRYDTSYFEFRRVAWDSYVDVRGNRYSVPAELVGQRVAVRIGLDGALRIYQSETLVATHTLRSRQEGWCTTPEHHSDLWREALQVEQRPLSVYEEVA